MHLTERIINGVAAVLLALKKRPAIRYANGSALARQLAHAIEGRIDEEAHLFHFKQTESTPLLLVLDRRDDPVTPLLNQWTYQAMVHELIGITVRSPFPRRIGVVGIDARDFRLLPCCTVALD